MLEEGERFKGVHKVSNMREIIASEWAEKRALQRLNERGVGLNNAVQ
jgi:hypothetical protein